MDDYLKQFREMISLRGLTDHTVKSYSTYIRAYLDYLTHILHKMPEDVSWEELRDFVRWLQKEKHLSDRTMNACISQLRFFTIYVLHKPWDATQLPLRRFDTFLPYVPSQKEVLFFIDSFTNLKHKAIVSLMYSAGLRVSEVRHIRYEDISRSSMRIHIRSSKSRSDRYAILSHNALNILTQYWFHADRPRGFLFPNQRDPDRPMASYTINQFISAKETALGWEHRFSCHTFRHAFGTHLYENGTDLLTIKALLGHKSLNSTTIYVHLASNGTLNAVSPFDQMGGVYHQ
ncbi:MAG: tyrosine-type recombinase/integrase [Lachnospiraceae bacterium]|nr:tyrosine-type recombinase/integrase [Lachnospiraceae bacterium]